VQSEVSEDNVRHYLSEAKESEAKESEAKASEAKAS
jgi:hypothetical protein